MNLSRYSDFLIEGKITSLILEGDMKATSDFIHKLKSISKSNEIAKLLYNLFHQETPLYVDLAQNFIDVSTEEDTVTFISDKKGLNSEDPFTMKGRSSLKIGRLIRSLLSNKDIIEELENMDLIKSSDDFKISDKDIENFVNLYKASKVDTTRKFKLVKGEKIAEWYNEEKYSSEHGSLGGSCMKDVDSDYFNIYVENDKVCRLLIYINSEGKLLGRALVWKMYESPCDAEYFMDRVYTSNDSDVIKFKNYAEEQGWLYKYSMEADYEKSVLLRYKQGPVFGKIVVQLEKSKFDEYPFVDTLCFLDKEYSQISNVGFKNGKMMDSTHGDTSTCGTCRGTGEHVDECGYCDEGYDECYDCSGGYNECDECHGKGYIPQGRGKRRLVCDKCKGEGKIICTTCGGKDRVICKHCKGNYIKKELCDECTGLLDEVKQMIKDEGEFREYRNVI